ncbi:MAG: histone deacetylase [Deltaproteobacteria bacterium]|nr:histone deacetylase [Deltaproteobacteria bacterium]
MAKTGIVRDNRYMEHFMGDYHPESPSRLQAIYTMLDEPEMKDSLVEIPPRFCTEEELLYIHSPAYISRIQSTAGRAVRLDPDTSTSPQTWEAAQLAVGGFLEAVDRVSSREVDNAFAFVRPPGHHAETDRSGGFCIFNNVAIGAVHAMKKLGHSRVLIVDWDLHHGNGTMHSFYHDPRVLYFSTHQFPHYPGSGRMEEVGSGEGRGATVNVPLSPGPGDAEYSAIFREILAPIARQFQPGMIMVSAGFDTYHLDPLGGMRVTPEGYAMMTKMLLELGEETCGGRVVFILEGGYHLGGLSDSIRSVLHVMRGDHPSVSGIHALSEITAPSAQHIVQTLRDFFKTYWPVLG